MSSDVCPGCDHLLSRHFRDITGVARCLVSQSGVSDSGVIGIPWHSECDCADGVSEQANRRRAEIEKDRAEHNAWANDIAAQVEKLRHEGHLPPKYPTPESRP